MDELTDHLMTAIKLIRAEKKESGTIVCPACKGKMHYTVSSYNGHIWAGCENEKCFRFAM